MGLGHRVSSIVAFLRAGYPACMPATGYIPLLALLRRRVTDDEIADIASELIVRGHSPIDSVDIGVEITRVMHEMPSLSDVERVQERIAAIGHPDPPLG
jgi:hypothetical protein